MFRPKRKIRYGKSQCRTCGRWITRNALGRAAHAKACKGYAGERAALEAKHRREK